MKKRLKEICGAGDTIRVGDAFTMYDDEYHDPHVYKLLSVTLDSEHPEVLTFTYREVDDPKQRCEACAWNRDVKRPWTRTFRRRGQTEVDLWWLACRRPRRADGWHPICRGLARGRYLWKQGEVLAVSLGYIEVISGKRGGIKRHKTDVKRLLCDVEIATGTRLRLGKKLGANSWTVTQTGARKPPKVPR